MEDFVLLLFLSAVALVYLLAALALIRIVLRRMGWIDPPSPAQLWLSRIVFGLAALGCVCFAYGYFIEPYRVSVTHVRLESAKLPRGSRPIRLVHISDLHSDPKVRLEEKLPDVIAAKHPDLIVFTGDAINSPAGLPVFKACMTRLAAAAPTFAVKGNWDAWYWGDQPLYEGTGVKELQLESVGLDIGGTKLWLAGLPVRGDRYKGPEKD